MLKIIGNLTPRVVGNGNILRHLSFSTQVKAETQNNVKHLTQDPNKRDEDKLFSRLEIELRGIDPAVLKSYSYFATVSAENLGIEVGNCWAPRKAYHDRMTLLKSVHIFKKHRVQYEIRTHFRFMNFYNLTGSTLYTYLEYIERNLPEGVNLNATSVEIQKMPSYLMEPPSA